MVLSATFREPDAATGIPHAATSRGDPKRSRLAGILNREQQSRAADSKRVLVHKLTPTRARDFTKPPRDCRAPRRHFAARAGLSGSEIAKSCEAAAKIGRRIGKFGCQIAKSRRRIGKSGEPIGKFGCEIGKTGCQIGKFGWRIEKFGCRVGEFGGMWNDSARGVVEFRRLFT